MPGTLELARTPANPYQNPLDFPEKSKNFEVYNQHPDHLKSNIKAPKLWYCRGQTVF
jgi:hypothetical protein